MTEAVPQIAQVLRVEVLKVPPPAARGALPALPAGPLVHPDRTGWPADAEACEHLEPNILVRRGAQLDWDAQVGAIELRAAPEPSVEEILGPIEVREFKPKKHSRQARR